MLWYCFLPPEFDALLAAPPGPVQHRAPGGTPAPTAVDLWLVDVAYGVAAAGTRCTRCGAALGARRRLTPSADAAPGWSVSVVVRCRGPWRHRHVATAARPGRDLVLGPLRAS